MMRSMFAGVSGLRTHQTMMDVVGNNIANVNTPGFKASAVTFAETISQVLRGASGSSSERAGLNPAQIGLGVKVGAIDGVFTQGASQVTGRNTDVAVQGDGFFVVNAGGNRMYTRAGSFTFDERGTLTGAGGIEVQGWIASGTGVVDTNQPISSLRIPVGQVIEPKETQVVEVGGSLSAETPVGGQAVASILVFDSLGNSHEASFIFTNQGVNDWAVSANVDGTPATMTPSSIQFNTDGTLATPGPLTISGFTPPGANPLSFDVVIDGPLSLVQFGGPSTVEASNKDGRAIGYLTGYTISDDGSIDGQFSNGENKLLGRLATATFSNPGGLVRKGDSNFAASVNSGEPLIGEPGTGNRGPISAGTLEMSNVDLAREFTNMIIAQRGFQANSRVITTSDEMLNDLVNLKR